MNTNTPNLGENWTEAIKSAYSLGYSAWRHSGAEVVFQARRIAAEGGERRAADWLANSAGAQAAISEDPDHRRLWRAIDDFYAEHMTAEQYERLQREAAVAEDLDSAFEAGAYDAILDNDRDPERVAHLHGE